MKMLGKSEIRIIRNNVFLLAASVFEKLVFLVLTIILARYLGVANYGRWGFAVAATSLIMVFADLGLSVYAVREISRRNSRYRYSSSREWNASPIASNMLVLKAISSIILTVAMIFISRTLTPQADTRITILLLSAAFIFSGLTSAIGSIYSAYQKMGYNAIYRIIGVLLTALGYIYVIISGEGIIGLAMVTIISNILLVAVNMFIMRRYFNITPAVDIHKWLGILKKSLPFGIIIIMSMIYFRIDVLMLSLMTHDDNALGLYSAASGLIINLVFIPYALYTTMFPAFSAVFKDKVQIGSLLKKSMVYVLILTVPVAIVLAVFPEWIILLVYGRAFMSASLSLRILSIYYVISSLTLIGQSYLYSIDKQNIVSATIIVGVVLNVLMNLYFIPMLSFIGASITTVASELMTLIVFWHYIRKHQARRA